MSIRFPAEIPLDPTAAAARGITQFAHGELLLGKVTRVSPDGMTDIKFGDIEARAHSGGLLEAGKRVFAQVQKTRDETLLSLLPNVEEGEILTGTAIRTASSRILARFGDSELSVRLPSSAASAPPEGGQIRAQAQVLAGKPVLQMLPTDASGSALGGTVVTDRTDGAIWLDVGGTTLIATTAEPLEAGERVQARMLQVGDKVILQALQEGSLSAKTAGAGGGGKIEELLAQFLATPLYAHLLEALVAGKLKIDSASRELLLLLQQFMKGTGEDAWGSALSRALETILLNPQKGELAQQLASAFTNSGIFLESRLLQGALRGEADALISGDLKLALLVANQKLSQMPQSARPGGGESQPYINEIAARVGQLLDAVTAEQFQNLRMLPSHEIYVQLPFAEGAGLERVELRIARHGKGAARKIDPRNVLLTLAVATSNLGRIRAALSIVNGQVSCQFRAERESVVALLLDNAGILREGLERLDYRVACIDCGLSKSERELAVFDESSVVPPRGLDVRV